MIPKNKRRNNPKGSSYFDPLINQYNGDIFKAPPKVLIGKMKRLAIDLTKGNVSYEKYGKYFTPVFIFHFAEYVRLKRDIALTHKEAMFIYANANPNSSFIQKVYTDSVNIFNVWDILNTNMKRCHQTGDVRSMIETVQSQCRDNYKNSISLDD